MDMDEFFVDFHHGGYFEGDKYIRGEVSNWKCDGDRRSYFEILGVVKEIKYRGVQDMWYNFAGTLKALEDDFGAIEALNWSKTIGKVDIFIVHPVEEPDEIVVLSTSQTNCEAQNEEKIVNDGGDHVEEENVEGTHVNDGGDHVEEENVEGANVNDGGEHVEEENVEGAHVNDGGDHYEKENVEDAWDHVEEVNVEAGGVHVEEENVEAETVEAETVEAGVEEGSDDSALADVDFVDSDDEILNDGFSELLVGEDLPADTTSVDILCDDTTETKKRKGGRPSKKKAKFSFKRHKGKPKKKGVDEGSSSQNRNDEAISDEDVIVDGDMTINKSKKVPRGLSDPKYSSEELESEDESEDDDRVKYPSFINPKRFNDYKWVLGSLFSTKEEFKEVISSYAVHNGRDLRYLKNDKNRARVGCKEGCSWVALCSKFPNTYTWQLRTLNDKHTCNREHNVRMFSSKWLGKKLQTTVRINPNVKLSSICEKVHEKWNTSMSRMKAYRARKTTLGVVEGSFREQFLRLYDYAHELLRSNPNSSIKLNVQATELPQAESEVSVKRPLLPSFHRLYMCLDACKKAFGVCRPIIGVDGCFLKGIYGGQLLAAVGRDPNDQMLPVAIAVVEAETKDSWAWFFDLLVRDLGGQEVCKHITFVSDQQKGLLSAIDELLPGVDQRFCVRHLYSNFRKRFPGKQLKKLMWKAAKATYPQAWEHKMREMRKVNEEAYKHLMKIPPRYWSKSMFKYNARCDVLVNNMSETFNSVIIGAREKPIVSMLEDIRGYLMDRWAKNRAKIEDYEESVLPKISKMLERRKEISRFFIPRLSGDMIYEVRHTNMVGEKHTVDLRRLECSCRSWMLTSIPCYHAISCMQHRSLEPADFIPDCYRKDTYKACYQPIIYPTNGENLWEKTLYPDILPPPSRRAPGRPKRRRNKDADENRKDAMNVSRKGLPNKCSICSLSGHNKASCPSRPREAQTANTKQSQTTDPVPTVLSQTSHPTPTVQSQPTPRVQKKQSQTTPTTSVQSLPTPRIQTRQSTSSSRIQTRQSMIVSQLLAVRRQSSTTTFKPPSSMRPKLVIRRKTTNK